VQNLINGSVGINPTNQKLNLD